MLFPSPPCAVTQARAQQEEGELCVAHAGVKLSAGGPPTKHPTGILPDGCTARGLRCPCPVNSRLIRASDRLASRWRTQLVSNRAGYGSSLSHRQLPQVPPLCSFTWLMARMWLLQNCGGGVT